MGGINVNLEATRFNTILQGGACQLGFQTDFQLYSCQVLGVFGSNYLCHFWY